MKHDFSIQEIVGALKKARGLQNYYTDAQLAHLFDMGREINDVLHFLPEPGPRLEHVDIPPISANQITATGTLITDMISDADITTTSLHINLYGYETCKTSALRGGDDVILLGDEDWFYRTTIDPTVFAPMPDMGLCTNPRTGKLIRLAEVDGTDELTLLRKPKPVVHPDPMEDHIIHCHDRINDYFWNGVVGSYMGLYDPRIQLSKEDFTNWSPAIIVTGETNG